MAKAFGAAKEAYLSGDPRKLAEFVRTNTLTPEQCEFVALVLAGEVEIKDRRSEKDWTRNLYLDYIEIKIGGELRNIMFGNKKRVSKAEIYRKLAELHGYSDEETVKKSIARADKRRNGYDLMEVFKRAQSQGRPMRMRFNWPRGITRLSLKERLEVLTDQKPERLVQIKLNRIHEYNVSERPKDWIEAFIRSFKKE